LIWAFGPGIILLYKREKYRVAKLMPTCPECGYNFGEVGEGESDICPQCKAKIAESAQ
jgi:predicted Zn-ribbon and HTH transcriptional regulator